jgi:acetaldehyde dehydrogenase/alcohol dehydrogenase
VGLVLPYTIEFSAKHDPSRFADLARFTGCCEAMGEAAARALAERLRALCEALHSPRSLAEAGIDQAAFEAALDKLVDDAFNDTSMVSASRSPSYEELRRLFQHAYKGQPVDF